MWVQSTRVLTPSGSGQSYAAIFINTASNVYEEFGVMAGVAIPPAGLWQQLDLTRAGVPFNANAVQLAGILIITDGANSGDASLALSFQAPGAGNDPGNYAAQAVAVGPQGGARTNATLLVPCRNGVIEWAWLRGDLSNGEWPSKPLKTAWPTGAAYGVNLSIQQVFLP